MEKSEKYYHVNSGKIVKLGDVIYENKHHKSNCCEMSWERTKLLTEYSIKDLVEKKELIPLNTITGAIEESAKEYDKNIKLQQDKKTLKTLNYHELIHNGMKDMTDSTNFVAYLKEYYPSTYMTLILEEIEYQFELLYEDNIQEYDFVYTINKLNYNIMKLPKNDIKIWDIILKFRSIEDANLAKEILLNHIPSE